MSGISLQHFVISSTKFKDLDSMAAAAANYESPSISNNCANMPVSFHAASNGCLEYLQTNSEYKLHLKGPKA